MPLIRPEKKVSNEQLKLNPPSESLQEPRAYGMFLNNSSLSHLVTQLMSTLGRDKAFQQWKARHQAEEQRLASPPHKSGTNQWKKYMSDLWDRVRNVYDDHQDRQRQLALHQGYQAALHETRHVLLSSTLMAQQQQWRQEVQAAGPNGNEEAVHAKYPARLQQLNGAFAALRQGDPGITTHIDIEQSKQSATERTSYQRQEHSLADNRIDDGYDYSILIDAGRIKLPTTSVNSATRFSGRSQCVVVSCGCSDPRGAAASRLLFGFTLDPLSGLRASNPVFCGASGFRFRQVNP